MGFFKKKKVESKVKGPDARQESCRQDTDLEHLTKEGNLPWGWHNANKDFKEQIQNEFSYFLNEWIANRTAEPKKRYETLKSFVLYMNDARNLCHAKSECHAFWFDEIIASPEYIAERTAELKELEANFLEIEAAYKKREKELAGLEERVEETLRQNEGILQADFVKLFDVSVKNEVSELLYCWCQQGKISRAKSGRSYLLHIKN